MTKRILVLTLAWLVVAVPAAALIWLHRQAETVVGGHDVTVQPTLDGWATMDLGPFLPDFRYPTGHRIGARIVVGKTESADYDTLIERYAAIAAAPQSQIDKLRGTVVDLGVDAAVLGAMVGLAGPLLIVVVGRTRWRELLTHLTTRRTEIGIVGLALVAYVVYNAATGEEPEPVARSQWRPLASVLTDVTLPKEAQPVQVDSGLLTTGSAALVDSLVSSYKSSLDFYSDLAHQVKGVAGQLHQPAADETIGLLVSDRHDNVDMDPVARAVYDAGHATFLMDAGDDTSTGSGWESFSLESLDKAFDDVKSRYGVAGNHDEGDFVVKTLKKLGFTMLVGEPVEGPDGIRFLGASDPRSSGLGSWLTEKTVTMDEQTKRLADRACKEDAAGKRITTLLVHDATVGREALARGCVDLVLAGHRHEQVGPTEVTGSNGQVGYEFTTGTTGGAAYAIALGSKLRRNAMVTLVTYREGRPVGLQPVTFRTVKDIVVSDYLPLDPRAGTPDASTTPSSDGP